MHRISGDEIGLFNFASISSNGHYIYINLISTKLNERRIRSSKFDMMKMLIWCWFGLVKNFLYSKSLQRKRRVERLGSVSLIFRRIKSLQCRNPHLLLYFLNVLWGTNKRVFNPIILMNRLNESERNEVIRHPKHLWYSGFLVKEPTLFIRFVMLVTFQVIRQKISEHVPNFMHS